MSSRRLRVLHVNLASAGIGAYGLMIGRALAEHEAVESLTVLNNVLPQSQRARELLDGMNIRLIPCRGISNRLKIVSGLRSIIEEWQPDVIHDSAGAGFVYGVLPLILVAGSNPLVITEHDPEPHLGMGNSPQSRLARYAVRRRPDHIFVHGPNGKDALVSKGVPEENVSVINMGSYRSLYEYPAANEITRENKTILFFGALRPNKGVQLLLPIAERIYSSHPDVRFIVAGPSAVARELIRLGWDKQLALLLNEMRQKSYFEVQEGYIPDKDVSDFFLRASITLIPYLDATQSSVAPTAMSFGSVVVATDVGDLPYIVRDGVTGLLTKPNVDALVEKLLFLLSDAGVMENVRRKALLWIDEFGDWSRIVDQVVNVYMTLL